MLNLLGVRHIFRGYLWLVLLIQPTTNLETFGGLHIEKDKQSLDFSLGFFEGKSCSKGNAETLTIVIWKGDRPLLPSIMEVENDPK